MYVINIRKYSIILLCILCCGVIAAIIGGVVNASTSPNAKYTIVIDAGHGGIDFGSEGYAGSKESELNLSYAITLKRYCEDYGFKVVLTRKDANGLYDALASNKKKDDMKKRKQIIEKVNPDIVISIHMNSFAESYTRGAQVFYNNQSDNSKALADCIQKQFTKNLVKARKSSQAGDYYIVNCTRFPSVICECGFISNREEENLLNTEDYKNQVCYSILCGVISYFA